MGLGRKDSPIILASWVKAFESVGVDRLRGFSVTEDRSRPFASEASELVDCNRPRQPIIHEDLSIEKAQLGLNDIVDRSCRDFQSFNAVVRTC
ncbi:hypothetical protein LOK49_LG10G01102 [Camellia lanceoleosa]|uniref:Uncharacterized protein n=1 Tax=Camellia lanceoleosa TaxID=1840588 RepID=A0ACC0G5U3_9ERIC|nr:hypothetical protein LOK49_LG10G01102 [Camellia lanceoleosa]